MRLLPFSGIKGSDQPPEKAREFSIQWGCDPYPYVQLRAAEVGGETGNFRNQKGDSDRLSSPAGREREMNSDMSKAKFTAALFIVIGACASAPTETLQFSTASGRPEAIFMTADVSEAAGQVASGCMNAGMTVVSNNGYQVTCEVAMSMTQSVMTQLVIDNSYSTTPRQFIQFNLADTGEAVRVQATGWVETQMAFGQMQRMPTDQTVNWRNQVQQMLFAVGGVPSSGTVDSSKKPRIGFQMAELGVDGSAGNSGAVFVSGVFPEGPAGAAGLRVCDRIESVNGTKIVNSAGYALEVSKASDGVPFKFIVDRDGEKLEFEIMPTTAAFKLDASTYQRNSEVISNGCTVAAQVDDREASEVSDSVVSTDM